MSAAATSGEPVPSGWAGGGTAPPARDFPAFPSLGSGNWWQQDPASVPPVRDVLEFLQSPPNVC